jgi:hypothetical protein
LPDHVNTHDLLVRTGVVRDYAEAARLGRVTRARMTQITKLLDLAPDIGTRASNLDISMTAPETLKTPRQYSLDSNAELDPIIRGVR